MCRITQFITRLKKDCRHDTSLAYTGLDWEVQAAAYNATGEVVVETLGDLDDVQENPIRSHDVP